MDGYIGLCFDSILVRLEGRTPPLTGSFFGERFDSILVRLEAHCPSSSATVRSSFDSILVRLEAKYTNPKHCQSRFDSILVRLEEGSNNILHNGGVMFRFHTGSIRSAGDKPFSYVSGQFRFHTGSIRR